MRNPYADVFMTNNDPDWECFSQGNFNVIYASKKADLNLIPNHPYRGKWVLKLPKQRNPTDSPDRVIAIWNILYPELPAASFTFHGRKGWIAPLVEGTTPSDLEIARAILDIYKKTGRIVVDGCSKENFVKDKDGRVICVDLGVALKLENRMHMPSSPVSTDFWKEQHTQYPKFWRGKYSLNPY